MTTKKNRGRVKFYNSDVNEWSYEGKLFHAMICDPPYELGFMNRGWDNSGVAFNPETWRNLGRHLYDGAFCLAFAGSRGWHRMAVAIEDGGFIIHPSIFAWSFGSGFPKATRIDNQVDALMGMDQEIVGKLEEFGQPIRTSKTYDEAHEGRTMGGGWGKTPDKTMPVSEQAKAWFDHRYGLQAMKPAIEPIILFQKPYRNKPVVDMMKTGAGALNIGGARVGKERRTYTPQAKGARGIYNDYPTGKATTVTGRWPPNFALIHDDNCTPPNCFCGIADNEKFEYFFQAYQAYDTWEMLSGETPVKYVPKASVKERDAGLEELPQTMVDDGREKSVDNAYQRGETLRHNPHPTIKPIMLTRWLATLLLPPHAYRPRRLMVPFSGVGSEIIGAQFAAWEHIAGIELSDTYISVAKRRIRWWSEMRTKYGKDIEKILGLGTKEETPDPNQLSFF